MTKLLASVRSAAEAQTALHSPIGVLDLKEPAAGALGALDAQTIREVVALVGGRCPTSATIGDLPPEPGVMLAKIHATAALGVDYVKIGFFGPDYLEQCLPVLAKINGRSAAASDANGADEQSRLVGVLFADLFADFAGPCRLLKKAGFHGVMIDTADKQRGSLRRITDDETLARFVHNARELGLLCGIAGSLEAGDVEPLLKIAPDYLGFRTALCEGGERNGELSADAVSRLARKLASGESVIPAQAGVTSRDPDCPAEN